MAFAGEQSINMSYPQTHDLSVRLLSTLQSVHAPISYSMLACALTLGRLANMGGKDLGEEEEIKFVQDTMDWTRAYWGIDSAIH